MAKKKEIQVTSQTLHQKESIYVKFVDNKETPKMEKWHQASWEDKFKLLDKFEDERLVDFGKKIIFQERTSSITRKCYKRNKERYRKKNFKYQQRKMDDLRRFLYGV